MPQLAREGLPTCRQPECGKDAPHGFNMTAADPNDRERPRAYTARQIDMAEDHLRAIQGELL